jgi:hypothetical protein
MGDSSGGFGVSDAIGNDIGDERSMRDPTAAASVGGGGADCNYSEGSLLTPRPMGSDDDDDDDDDFETNSTKHQLPINEQSKGAIDLTRDDDDDDDTFYFDSVDDKDNKKQPSKTAAKSRHSSDDKDSWECRQCTLLNPHDASICKVCDTPRQSSRSSAASEKTTAEQMKSRKKLRVLDDSDSDSDDDDDDGDTKPKKRKSNNAASGIDAINKKRDKGDKSTTTGKQRKTGSKGSAKESSQLWKWTQSQSTQGSTSAAAAATSSSSRARLANKFRLSTSSTQSTAADAAAKGSSEMWIDKHAPRTTKELCIAPKKIDEVKSWLASHVNSRQSKRKPHSNSNNNNKAMSMHTTPYDNPLGDNPPPDTKMMILIGSPGIGKSAMVKVLAREMNLEILTWNDAHVDYVDNSASFQISGGGGGAGEYLPYQSQLASFEEFLNAGGLGMDSLDVAGLDSGGGGGGKCSKSGRTSLTSEKDGEYEGSVILIEEVSRCSISF